MTPTIGRIVIYRTDEEDREFLRNSRANVSYDLPAIVVAVWNDTCINLKVITDGPIDMWKSSVIQGEGERQWLWPVINK